MTLEITSTAIGADVRLGHFTARLQPDLFRDVADESGRRRLFAQSVQNVTFELSSYCNRRCRFCPNTGGTRLKGESILPQEIFEKAIRDLASIEYRRRVYFHLYNEPLAAPELLIERMSFARRILPHAHFALNTNGDYLSLETLRSLGEAGCSSIYVSVYGPDHGSWDDHYVRERVEKIAESLGIHAPIVSAPGLSYQIQGDVGPVDVRIGARNLWKSGYDRGGMLPELRIQRTSPCLSPITEFIVDHRGYSLPCCNVYTDNPTHARFATGRLSESDIFAIYAGQAYQRWRAGVFKFDPKGTLCEGCARGEFPDAATEKNREAIDAARFKLGIDF